MKNSIVTFCLLLLICLSLAVDFDPEYDYGKYMSQFKRKYKGQQKNKHEKIFKQNLKEIKKLLSQGHDVEVNQFTDWDSSQLQNFLNYHPEQFNPNPKPLKASLLSALPNPTEYDWRALDRVTEIKDQGQCGSCWAFASTALFESQLAMQQAGKKYDLAQQYLLECQKTYSSGCNGGYPFQALRLSKQTGLPQQPSYPYTQNSTSYPISQICSSTQQTIQPQIHIGDIDYRQNISITDLEQLLISNGPIVVGIDASNLQFLGLGSTGLVFCLAPVRINHAVLLVGFNASHWFIKNSWGVNWGNNGYGYIDKNNDCLLRQTAISAYLEVPTPTLPNTVNLTINLSDSYGDGWEGSIVAFKQNGAVVGTFGANYTYGYNKGPFYLQIPANIQTQVVLYQIGNYTKQMGFNISSAYQKSLFVRVPGLSIPRNTIFLTFCPDPKLCSLTPTITYYLSLNDTFGDGWNGNILGFRANGIVFYNFTLPTGRTSGPIAVVFDKYVKVQIVVVVLGSWTDQTGFSLRNQDGFVVAAKANNVVFSASSILGTFYPESTNLSPVLSASPTLSQQQKSSSSPSSSSQQITPTPSPLLTPYQISTIILAPICLILLLAIVVLSFKLSKLNQHKMQEAQSPSIRINGCVLRAESLTGLTKVQMGNQESCTNLSDMKSNLSGGDQKKCMEKSSDNTEGFREMKKNIV